MKHKILIFLLALGASTGTIFAQSGTCGDNLTWDLTDGVLTISGTGAMTDYAKVSDVPWYNYIGGITNVVFAEGCGITSIGNRSFATCSSLTSITIPNSVTTIGDYAFYGCSSLASVTISNSVVSIGYAAFYSCSGLTSVTIPNTVAVIGDFAFGSCSSLTSVTIPESVMTIGYGGTFQDCTALTKVQWNAKNCIIEPFDKNYNGYYAPFTNDKNLVEFTFGDKVESIPSWLCRGLEGLKTVHIPNSVTNIGDMAFNGCTGLTSPVYNAHVFAYMPPSYSGAYTIPDGIESIAGDAFYRCAGLTSITIPNSVKSIGNDAFYECNNLTSVCISDLSAWCNISFENYQGVTHPLFYAEHLYLNGSEVTDLKIPDNVSTIKNYAFYWCKGLTSVTIPNSVTSIGNSAFSGCSGLTSVTIPNSVTNIGDRAFSICTGLTSVTIPNSVISIGDYAFNGCTSLTTITIPNSITHIGGWAFYGCSGLTSVTIPNSVTSIGYVAFADCTGLTSVTCYATTPPEQLVYMVSGNYIWPFYGVDCSQIPLYVPAESIEAYKAADGWKDFTNIQAIDSEEPCVIASGTCGAQGDNLTWTLSCDSVLTINGTGAMTDYPLRKSPFYEYCTIITSVIINDGVTSIGNNAFHYSSNLTSVTIPNSVTSIGENAFFLCRKLSSISVPNSIITIGQASFSAGGLTSIVVDAENIIYDSRDNCNAIIETASNTLVAGCQNTIIPSSVIGIGEFSFYNCSGLTRVTIPSSVTNIGDNAFRNCKALNTVIDYATTPQSITANVFSINIDNADQDLSNLTLYVPQSAIEAYRNAAIWQDFGQIRPIAEEKDIEQITFIPESNAADVAWPKVADAASYELIIRDTNGELVDSLVFDADGRLLTQISFAPARRDAPHKTQTAGFAFTITGLESNTTYYYILTTKNESGTVLDTQNGSFITKAPQDIENTDAATKANKVCHNGQVLILRGDKTYTLTGQIIKQ